MGKFYILGLSIGFGAGFATGLSVGRSEANRMKKNLNAMVTDHSIKVLDASGKSLTGEELLVLLNKKK
ncbi:MAG: hypothetical protein ACO21J_02710 [Anaerohalosphaeraceae bacterium]|jgi:hypothetical protein